MDGCSSGTTWSLGQARTYVKNAQAFQAYKGGVSHFLALLKNLLQRGSCEMLRPQYQLSRKQKWERAAKRSGKFTAIC